MGNYRRKSSGTVAAGAGKSPARVAAGAVAQERGESSEEVIDVYRLAARNVGYVSITRVAVPTRVKAEGGAKVIGKSTVDGIGYLLGGSAMFVAEEVKSLYDGGCLSLRRVKKHQRDFLDRVYRDGGIAVLTIVRHSGVSVVPWALVRGNTRVTEEQIDAHRVTPHTYGRAIREARHCRASEREIDTTKVRARSSSNAPKAAKTG